MKIDIVLHPSGDWEGLYLDNALWNEGHSIYTESLITALTGYIKSGKPVDDIQYNSRDLGNEEGFDEDFSFPLKYEDINPSIKLGDTRFIFKSVSEEDFLKNT